MPRANWLCCDADVTVLGWSFMFESGDELGATSDLDRRVAELGKEATNSEPLGHKMKDSSPRRMCRSQ